MESEKPNKLSNASKNTLLSLTLTVEQRDKMTTHDTVTVVIPVASYHRDLLQRAIASVQAQTKPCSLIVVVDHDLRGSGWARNQGLARVKSPFVCFLDADDELMPMFVERTLLAWRGRYLYTDWIENGAVHEAPNCAWKNGTWHVVTTLLPTVWALMVGGFDEILSGGEDSDFYVKLCTHGYCGQHLREPLFHYGGEGRRSQRFRASVELQKFQQLQHERYEGKEMACCGDSSPMNSNPDGEPEPGDVLAQAMYPGNRRERGRVTGRLYPRTAYPKQLWMAAEDIDFDNQQAAKRGQPPLFRRVETAPPPPLPETRTPMVEEEGVLTTLDEIAAYMFGALPAPAPVVENAPEPNLAGVLALYQRTVNPEMKLLPIEVEALRHGDEVAVNAETTEVKVVRRRAKDTTTRKPRKAKPSLAKTRRTRAGAVP